MNKRILIIISIICFTLSNTAYSQTVDEVISKYLNAIGGKEQLSKIKTLFTESKIEIIGNDLINRTYILNGIGYKNEMEMMGAVITNCLTENGGWVIDPSSGSSNPQTMTEEQFNSLKYQIFIGAPFIFYKEKGYDIELIGKELVGQINAYKIKLISPNNLSSFHFFDPKTGYLIKSVIQELESNQKIETTILYSDYQEFNGYKFP